MSSALKSIPPLFAVIAALAISVAAQSNFDTCLDKNINKEDTAQIGSTKSTAYKTLVRLKARCRNGKLIDAHRREITFFKHECWGNPPADYLELQQRQRSELARLKRKYTVIEIVCVASPASPH